MVIAILTFSPVFEEKIFWCVSDKDDSSSSVVTIAKSFGFSLIFWKVIKFLSIIGLDLLSEPVGKEI